MKIENKKRAYGHGKDRKDDRLVMRMTKVEDDKLQNLTQYYGKTRSDVMRHALNMLYESEGGDEILNKPPKNTNAHFSLSNTDLDMLSSLSNDTGDSESEVVRKALTLFKMFKEMN